MIKKLIFGVALLLLLLLEVGYIQYRLSNKLQTMENIQTNQKRQLYLLEGETRKTIYKVNFLRHQQQKKLQQNELPGIYLAAN